MKKFVKEHSKELGLLLVGAVIGVLGKVLYGSYQTTLLLTKDQEKMLNENDGSVAYNVKGHRYSVVNSDIVTGDLFDSQK